MTSSAATCCAGRSPSAPAWRPSTPAAALTSFRPARASPWKSGSANRSRSAPSPASSSSPDLPRAVT